MPRRSAPPSAEPENFNMTPMIDVVFQLLIFFMLATQMAAQQTEALKIPPASMAKDVKAPDELLVNVTAEGRVRVGGRTFSDEALESLFEGRRHLSKGLGYPVLVRADRSTNFEHVQKVLLIASAHGAVSRVHLAATKE
jgi:biopolymer transport protein ExbD